MKYKSIKAKPGKLLTHLNLNLNLCLSLNLNLNQTKLNWAETQLKLDLVYLTYGHFEK